MARDPKGRFVKGSGSTPSSSSPDPDRPSTVGSGGASPNTTAGDGKGFSFVMVDGTVPGLRDMLSRLADMSPALDAIGAAVVSETQMRFELQEAPDGTKWAGLSEVTKAQRKAGGASRILRETGDNLYDTLTHQLLAGGDGVAVGVNRWWSTVHQFGGMAGRGRKVKIPARPFLGLSEAAAEEVLAIAADHVARSA